MLWGVRRFWAHFSNTTSSHGIKPYSESLRLLNLGQMFQRTEENLLCRILCVFLVSTDFHAEGIDRVLEQADCFRDSFRRIKTQEIGGLSQFWAHGFGLSKTRSVYSFDTQNQSIDCR